MKRVLQTWGWSLTVAARSPVTLVGLALVTGLWGIAAYEWLALPESSVLILLIILLWAVAQWVVAAAVVAGTASSAGGAAVTGAKSLPRLGFVTFRPRLIARTILFSAAAALAVFGASSLFGWVNAHSVEVGSFLTFHTETPTSHVWIEKVFDVMEDLLWVAIAGLLLRLLVSMVRAGWRKAGRDFRRAFADCFWKGSFPCGVLAVILFAWIPYRLANWRPNLPHGFWDYFQMLARLGLALLLVTYGWLFWLLALARLSLPVPPPAAAPADKPSPPQS